MGSRDWQVLALARKMMDGRSKQDILDSSYHRYAFHDTGVPKWFYEDEKRHMRYVSAALMLTAHMGLRASRLLRCLLRKCT